MAYIVSSSEKLQKSANDAETKALLYLMSFREDSDEIHYFIIDFLNDVTGMNKKANKLWDLQSKGAKESYPKEVGRELVTLYKNYISDFEFSCYILFLGGVSQSFRKDSSINNFGIGNISGEAILRLKEGLKDECSKKKYIDDSKVDDDSIEEFLKKVYFVIESKDKSEYVRNIIKTNSNIIPNDEVLIGIFNEIKKVQSSKKSLNVVEGIKLEELDEIPNYGRHLTSTEIKMLVLNRLINQEVMTANITPSFINIYNTFPEGEKGNMLEDCQLNLSAALFNVNYKKEFWELFEDIYNNVLMNPKDTVDQIYRKLNDTILEFDIIALKYFIALIKDGMEK
ncbi:hypothetical protein [Tissierella praeacuta]|uniref:hypothetical protein n=1 Tax=Tissierella praeacuta TaxID=43131 RepID=UPI0028A678C6|nr:hypothetical protein [Tissierella praeacuta]